MNRKPYEKEQTVAFYFSLEVEIVEKLDNCSLIRHGDLSVVVDTQDLVFCQVRKANA
ncbi:MAG: hypothetical protein L0387_32430 [Acidobacteria bacterium]|nr:hypothetical protein [Acidobacteriota bacterium]